MTVKHSELDQTLSQRGIHYIQRLLPPDEVHIGDTQNAPQLLGRHFHGTGRIGLARLRLRERRGSRRVKRHVSFNLLHGLVDVPVQHRDGTESFQLRERQFVSGD